MRYIPVEIEEFSNNKLKHLEQMKQFLQEQLPVRTEAMEGYITIQGDAHISDKVFHMLEHAVYRLYFSDVYKRQGLCAEGCLCPVRILNTKDI